MTTAGAHDGSQIDPRLKAEVSAQPYPLLFVTISGAHLYGFPSPDSDFDLRGVHLLPAQQLLGLDPGPETLQTSHVRDGLEVDLVTHDAGKFFGLLLKKNGYVLEQVFSPLVVQSMPEHDELKAAARRCVTRHHSHHYLGFAHNQWRLFEKEQPRRIKPLLYTYRVLLSGIHLMQTGEIQANLLQLNEGFRLPQISELVDRKLAGAEASTLPDAEVAFHQRELERLLEGLEAARDATQLPDMPQGRAELNDLLIRLRINQ